ncbi:hypothetical protein TNCV_2405741 [Trichonephila clavipes]|nr:hypothetical protein TNCV_2405741 [Trichonephila clavipes]
MHFANWRLFYEENRRMLLDTEKNSLTREFRKMEVRLYCILSLSSLHLRHRVNRKTLKKLKALEKSAHPCLNGFRGEESGSSRGSKSLRLHGVDVWRMGCQFRRHPCYLKKV